MLEGSPALLLLGVDANYTPWRFSADLHGQLVDQRRQSVWLHAADDLRPAFQLATMWPEHPMVVTTSAPDWSPFEDDRLWSERRASMAFVLAEEHLPRVPPQVGCLLSQDQVRRRNRAQGNTSTSQTLETECTRILGKLLDDVRVLKMFAHSIGIEWARIDSSGSVEVVAFHVVLEAARCDRLDRLTRALHERYPRDDTDDLRRRVLAFYYDSNY